VCTDGARIDARRAPEGVCPGGPSHRKASARDHVHACVTQRAGTRARARDAPHRRSHHHRGHAVVPRRRRAAHAAFARHADPHLRAVIVNRVDDENALANYAVVLPGLHKVTLDLPKRKGFKLATQETLELETRPCVRYVVAAELKSVTLQEWTPVVRREERIG